MYSGQGYTEPGVVHGVTDRDVQEIQEYTIFELVLLGLLHRQVEVYPFEEVALRTEHCEVHVFGAVHSLVVVVLNVHRL